MNASDMTFGIEIECFLPNEVIYRNRIVLGGYHAGVQIPGLPAGWKAQRDGSLSTTRPHHTAIEVTSPILRGRDGIEQVIAVVDQLNAWGAHTNKTCGFHVHVGAGLRQQFKVVRNLVHLVAKFERALFAVTGTKSREHGRFAAPVNAVFAQVVAMRDVSEVSRLSRYHSLNLTNLTRSGTVEFRVFQGTTNLTKILGYIQICLGLVENAFAMKRTPTKACKNVRHQDGRGLLYRMARNFNWYSEKRMGDRKFGLLTPERLEAIKRELERLADKYDADAGEQHPTLRPVV